jgi:hypothetical protein
MSDRFGVEIQIGGQLPVAKVQDLIDAINSEGMSLDWGECPIRLKTREDLINCLASKESPIVLVDDERAWGDIDDLEQTCQELGLIYKIIVEPRYEYSGELKFWSPATGLIELECESGGKPIATQEELKEILCLIKHQSKTYGEDNLTGQEKAIEKLEKLTQEFIVPAFEIVEK